jgi:hypothetical protein
MYVPSAGKAPKDGKRQAGDNALDDIKEDIERIKDENIKKNRDTLDALYNIDMRNMSESMKRLFSKMGKAVASVETLATDVEAAVNIVAQYGNNLAAVQLKAEQNSASINSIVKWQSEVDSSIQSTAQIQQTVRENEARISLLVNASGDGLSSSAAGIIATAIAGQDSLLQLIADKVEISADNIDLSGYVTIKSLDTNGTTEVSGNRISVVMDGTSDNESGTLSSSSRIYFKYDNASGSRQIAGGVGLLASGEQSTDHSRYGMYFWTDPIEVGGRDTEYNPAIKFEPAGGFSVRCYREGPIYLEGRDFTLLDADGGVRIRAPGTYASCMMYYDDSSTDYVFATDGIYYGGKKILST